MTELIATVPKMHVTTGDLELLVEELRAYHAVYRPLFRRRDQRAGAYTYLHGLLSELPRKSIEPMVLAWEGVHPKAVRAMQACISEGAWDDETLLHRHWQEGATDLSTDDGVLMVDGSDFPKQGEHSVGVKRQYCGELGTRANGQAGVLLGYASQQGYTLGDRRLYLPQEWLHDAVYPERRKACGIPEHVVFTTKPMLGWAMLQAVVQAGTLRCRWVTGDEAFGRDTTLLDNSAGLGLGYFAAVPHDTHVWPERPGTAVPAWSGRGRRPQRQRVVEGQHEAQTVVERAVALPTATWSRQLIQEGSQGPLVADCATMRVIGVRNGWPGPEVWLGLRRHVETGELKTSLSNAPGDMAAETLVRMSGMRWPIETCCEDGKQRLGLGDYDVRSWTGWHQHMTLVILAHFFVVRLSLRLKKKRQR